MRWVDKKVRLPKIGDIQTKNTFLLFPTRLYNVKLETYETRWLEHATMRRVYEDDGFPVWMNIGVWSKWEWHDE